jgi:hypothetical protein
MTNMDLVSNLEDISTLRGKEGRFNNLLFFGLGVDGRKLNPLPHKLFKKFLRTEKIVFVVLLQDIETRSVDQGFDMDRCRINLGCHIHKLQFVNPGFKF